MYGPIHPPDPDALAPFVRLSMSFHFGSWRLRTFTGLTALLLFLHRVVVGGCGGGGNTVAELERTQKSYIFFPLSEVHSE